MKVIPCINCICLPICKGQALKTYEELIKDYSDEYAIISFVEMTLLTPLAEKCEYMVTYIINTETDKPKVYKPEYAIHLFSYLHEGLAIMFKDALAFRKEQYENYSKDRSEEKANDASV